MSGVKGGSDRLGVRAVVLEAALGGGQLAAWLAREHAETEGRVAERGDDAG